MDTYFNKNLIIGLSITFGSILIAGVALYFVSGTIGTNVKAILADKSKISQQSNAIGVIAALKEQVVQAAPYQAAMDQLLPTQDQLINFQQWVANIAAADHVSATASFQGDPSPGSNGLPGQLQFTVSATGPVNDVTNFLTDIELRSPGFLLQFDSLDLVDQGSADQLTAQGVVFFN